MNAFNFKHSFEYDTDLAQMYFDDFVSETNTLRYGVRDFDYYVLFATAEDKDKKYYKVSALRKMKKTDLYDLCVNFDLVAYWEDEKEYLKKDFIEMLLTIDNEAFYNGHYENIPYKELDHDFVIRGNCQGDYVKIKLVGKFEPYMTSQYLEQVFFQTPIYCRVSVLDGNYDEIEGQDELYIDSFVKDLYNFDKSEVLEIVKAQYKDELFFIDLCNYVENCFENEPK